MYGSRSTSPAPAAVVGLAMLLAVAAVAATPSATPPPPPQQQQPQPRVIKLGVAKERDALLWVPPTYDAAKPSPLLVLLHAAGKGAADALALLDGQQQLLFAQRVLVLLPQTRGATYDLQEKGSIGADADLMRAAVAATISRFSVDRGRMALAGFSDGATYALSLLPLGSIFSTFIAFSPGGLAPAYTRGAPRVFISHGARDALFPIDQTGRAIAPRVRQLLPRSQVALLEFDGGHEAPRPVVQAALDWWLLNKAPAQARIAAGRRRRRRQL